MNPEPFGRLQLGKHSSPAQTIEPGKQSVTMYKIGDLRCIETVAGVTGTCSTAGAKSLLVENGGDLGVDMIVQERVDEFYDFRGRLHRYP